MKKKKKSEGTGNTTMNTLWRQAVLANYHFMCPKCGNTILDEIECHHIVKRRDAFLKWDYRNGIPGCKGKCHNFYHTKKGEKFIAQRHKEYELLCELEQIGLKSYLIEKGLTRAEFLLQKKEELKNLLRV
jgi:predicted RNA-binding Zn-ribbon protein involved in translation (DUF1610 family)